MKRKIKFRAWAIAEKRMCEVTTLTDEGAFLVGIKPAVDQILMDGKYIVRGCDNGRFLNNGEFELMQFTGLRDKNGVSIYEGDIVKQSPGFGCEWEERIGIINHQWASYFIDFKGIAFVLDDHDCYLEVIGNIYSTPELIN